MSIRKRIGNYILNRQPPKYIQKGFNGWGKVDNLLIIAEVNQLWTQRQLLALMDFFREEDKVLNVIYFDPSFEEDTDDRNKHLRLGKKSLNFWGLPKTRYIEGFLKRHFDLMICLDENLDLHTQYFCNRIPARFRIGAVDDEICQFDIIIRRPEDMNTMEYLKELVNYLNRINSK